MAWSNGAIVSRQEHITPMLISTRPQNIAGKKSKLGSWSPIRAIAIERSKLAAQVLYIISYVPATQCIERENYKLPRRTTRAIAILRFVESPVSRQSIEIGSSKTARHRMLFAMLVLRLYFRRSMQYSRATFGFSSCLDRTALEHRCEQRTCTTSDYQC